MSPRQKNSIAEVTVASDIHVTCEHRQISGFCFMPTKTTKRQSQQT